MENFEYQAGTRILFGKGQIGRLSEVVKQYGTKVLLCYGGGSIRRSGLYDEIFRLLDGCEILDLGGIAPNPRIDSVREGVRICREHDVDVVLAVGGGSVIDCAKAVSAAVFHDGDPWEMITSGTLTEKALPIVAVLTIAATGSEYDAGAVISNPVTCEKLGYNSPLIQPAVSILDPSFSFSVSAGQSAAGAVDIISHLLEQYFTSGSSYLSDQFLTGALKCAIKYALVVIEHPDDYEARAELMWLSSLACNGILSLGGVYSGWSCHAIEHELSAFHDVTHGVGLAIITPRWMRHVLNEGTVSRFVSYGTSVWGIDGTLDPFEIAGEAIDKTEAFFRSLGVPMSLSDLGIGSGHFDEMASRAVETGGLGWAYVPLSEDDVKQILTDCLQDGAEVV